MKLKILVVLFFLSFNLYSSETKYFEGKIEYNIKMSFLKNDFFGLDSNQIDSLKGELESGKNEDMPSKLVFYMNSNGDFRQEIYSTKLLNFTVYKFNNNKFYTQHQDSLILETDESDNMFKDLNITKSQLKKFDTLAKVNDIYCNIIRSESEGLGYYDYYYSDSLFVINPELFSKNTSFPINEFAVITKSLPVKAKAEILNILGIEQTLISYKEYEIADNFFEIDTTKVKTIDELYDEAGVTEEDKKAFQEMFANLSNKFNVDSLDADENYAYDDEESEESEDEEMDEELKEEVDKLILKSMIKLNLELTREFENGKITKEELNKSRKLLEEWNDGRIGKIEEKEVTDEDEELFLKLLDRLSEIIKINNDDE